jgi:hypothetical protein
MLSSGRSQVAAEDVLDDLVFGGVGSVRFRARDQRASRRVRRWTVRRARTNPAETASDAVGTGVGRCGNESGACGSDQRPRTRRGSVRRPQPPARSRECAGLGRGDLPGARGRPDDQRPARGRTFGWPAPRGRGRGRSPAEDDRRARRRREHVPVLPRRLGSGRPVCRLHLLVSRLATSEGWRCGRGHVRSRRRAARRARSSAASRRARISFTRWSTRTRASCEI